MKFNNPTTAQTYQVVMFHQRLQLIVVVGFIKVDFLYQTQFLEPPEGAIDRGQTKARLLIPGSAIDLISIQVPLPVVNNFQN